MRLVLWCTCKAETVEIFQGMSIEEMRSFVLNNDLASLDVSQGDRTLLDYVASQGAECAAIDLYWYARGRLE